MQLISKQTYKFKQNYIDYRSYLELFIGSVCFILMIETLYYTINV